MSNGRQIRDLKLFPVARSRDRVVSARTPGTDSHSLNPLSTPKFRIANPRLELPAAHSRQSIQIPSDREFKQVFLTGFFPSSASHSRFSRPSRRTGYNLPPRRNSRPQAGYSREAVLLGAVVLLVVLASFTAFASRMYHKTFHVLADQWFARGDRSFQAGNAAEALNDYRNALAYSPYNPQFQFHLARALAATGRQEEAEAYLLNLLSVSPGSGEINLELARSSARRKSGMAAALRYYQAAIYGEWDHDPLLMRWDVRRELSEYLLAHGTHIQAEPELIAMAENVPLTDIARQKLAGELLVRGQLWDRALAIFRSVLAADPRDPEALAGAGTAAFHLFEFPQTLDYLRKLPPEKRSDPSIAGMLETSEQVLADDPFPSGLSPQQKAARTARDLALAESRAEQCVSQRGESFGQNPPKSDLQKLLAQAAAMKAAWSERMLARFPERIHESIAVAFQMENAANVCGEPQGPDRVIWLLGQTSAGKAP